MQVYLLTGMEVYRYGGIQIFRCTGIGTGIYIYINSRHARNLSACIPL